jgi:hypothetical protein
METADPMQFCESQREFAEQAHGRERGTICECTTKSGEVQLSCMDTKCLYCTSDESVCLLDAQFGGTISSFVFFMSNMDISQYVEGRDERVAIEQTPDGYCTVSIDGEKCASFTSQICQDESFQFSIDCMNVLEGATEQTCKVC